MFMAMPMNAKSIYTSAEFPVLIYLQLYVLRVPSAWELLKREEDVKLSRKLRGVSGIVGGDFSLLKYIRTITGVDQFLNFLPSP